LHSIASERRFRWWDYPVFLGFTVLHFAVLGAVLVPWILSTDWSRVHPIFLLVLGIVFLEFGIWEARWLALPLMRVPLQRPPRDGWRVGVAVTFVPGAESTEMLQETLRALLAMEYPHDTWVLDEGDDPEVRRLCLTLGARHFSRLRMPRYQAESGPFKARTKYGNYNAWLEQFGYEAYDLMVAFDSDHIARPDYLLQVLGHFDDERLAYVQPPQAYYNQNASFIARAAAEETYAYYSSIQMTAHAVGYPIVVGCHNTHRVTALRQIGGFAPHEADDMVMTLLYRAHGWRGLFFPSVLARGLTPVAWDAYLKQQRRWARSVLDFKLRVFPKHAARLPLLERIFTYVHGVYYLRGPLNGLLIALLVSMLASSTAPAGSGIAFLRNTAAVWATALLCDLYRQRFFVDAKREWGLHWRSGFVGFVKWPYFVLAFVDALRGKYGAYTVTPKTRRSTDATGFAVTNFVVVVVVSAAWLVNYVRGPSTFLPIHIAAAVVVLSSIAATVTALWQFPPAYEVRVGRSSAADVAVVRDVISEPLGVPDNGRIRERVRREVPSPLPESKEPSGYSG
jgi:cellulose synthase (UDP-forming)